MMKIKKRHILLFVWLCFFTATVFAQKSWEKKPFREWSKEETLKTLNNSPWVQSYQSSEALAAADQEQIGRERADTQRRATRGPVGRNITPAPVYIRLHSALPIRQAFVRLQQLEVGYDKWDEKKRLEFDAATKNILDCPLCQNYYIVTLTKAVNSSGQGVEEGLFQTMKLEDLKGNVWLTNEKGEKRELVEFTPPKGGRDLAVFFFARRDDKSNSLLTEQNKELKLVFNNSFLNSQNPYVGLLPRSFDFKVSRLMVDDKIEF